MRADKTEAGAVPGRESRLSFFRQSGWMFLATLASGCFMYAVHVVAKEMPKPEYAVFMTLLQILNMMTIPAMGLQLTFTQQAVSAVGGKERRQLAGTVRGVLGAAVVVWALMAVVVFVLQKDILAAYKIGNPAALWVTVALALMSVCNPMMMGLLQGKMDFFWLGWAHILNGVGRFVAVAIAVLLLGGWAAGAMTGAWLGMFVGLGVAGWQTRELWRGQAEPIQWGPWLGRVVPLTLGFGAATVMMSWDMIVVQRFFEKETGFYAAAGMIGRALVFLTAPLTAVMFPKVVQSAARAEKTNVLAQALGATALLGAGAALGCTLLPELPLRIVYDRSFFEVAPLVPWFAWCMLPLTLANVLINNLLARKRFRVVPWLGVVAVGYAGTLWYFHPSFEGVVQTLGLFGLLFLGVCLLFTWREAR